VAVNPFRTALAALGVAVLALALASLAAPSLIPTVSEAFVVTGLGLVLALFGAVAVRRRYLASGERTAFGTPESRRSLPRPGTEVDRELAANRVGPETRVTPPDVALIERLKPVAVDVVSRALNCAPATATEKLDDGSWTDDPHAAAFFSGQRAAELRAGQDSFFGAVFDRGPTRADLARRAILELSRLDETPAAEANGDVSGAPDDAERASENSDGTPDGAADEPGTKPEPEASEQ